MSAYAICIVQPPGYLHSAAFREVGESLLHGLRRLGHDAILSSEASHRGRRAIVLGSNLLPSHPLPLPDDAILYNLEQIEAGSAWLPPQLVELFRRHEVWDYSARNASRYAELGLARPRVVPVGHVPELVRIPKADEEEIDVLFYGSVNGRRQAILDALRARGLRVEAVFGVYGDARDRLIARSKIVLNVHFYEARVFEIVRVSYLLSNRRCVVSERGADPAEESELEAGIAFAAYGDLVDTCVRLAADPAAREKLCESGQALMTRRDAVAYLRDALAVGCAPAPACAEPAGESRHAQASSLPASLPAYYQCARPEVIGLARPRGCRVLDVGCAAGAMGAAMLAAGATEVVGIEVHPPAAALARSRLTAVYGYDLDGLPVLPYPEGYFDVITCADVLEHLKDPAAALRHLSGWLAPGGRVVCSIPNVRHESVLLPLLFEGRWDYVDAGILDRTHLRFFTVASAVRLLADAGLALDGRVQTVTTAPSPLLVRTSELIATLGGDARKFQEEATVVQILLAGRCTAVRPRAVGPILDPWRGSRPVHILIAPDLADPTDSWAPTLSEVVAGLGASDQVTVGITLPVAALSSPPAVVREVAAHAKVDLLLTEAPSDTAGWERLLGGASIWLATSARSPLLALAQRVGVEVRNVHTAAPAAPAAAG